MKTLLKWTLFLTGLMPFVYSAGSLFPYIFPKALFFRFLVFIAVVVFVSIATLRKSFVEEMIAKIKSLWKHPVFKWMALLHLSLVITTIFAYDKYMAMFGNIEREEGFLGLFFFYVFFVLITLIFEKRDWLIFFAVNLFTGGILFLVEINQYFGGMQRPGSLTDNPIFLANYYLFTIFGALVIWKVSHAKKNMLAMIVSMFSVIISILGLFITETRGTILGAFAGIMAVLLYFGFYGKNIHITPKISARKFTTILVAIFIFFTGIFIFTRHSSFWVSVPGLNRIAQISTKDATTEARLTNASIVFHAVNPSESNLTRGLFGWGWDNYVYAWQKFYNPVLYGYDQSLFDRAHNKLLDMLLMSGIVGLFTYLLAWFFFLKKAWMKEKKFDFVMALFIFWGVAYFLQNLTVFDTLVTYLTFYAMFAYLVYETQ